MEIKKSDARYYSVKVMSKLPLSEQLHEANAVLCTEAADDESVFLERLETQNSHIVLLYRLWRRKNGKGKNKESLLVLVSQNANGFSSGDWFVCEIDSRRFYP